MTPERGTARDGSAVTDPERWDAMAALKHNPLRCRVTGCPICRQYYAILLAP
jgi:hypothetical protein